MDLYNLIKFRLSSVENPVAVLTCAQFLVFSLIEKTISGQLVLEELGFLFLGHHAHFLQTEVGRRIFSFGECVVAGRLITGEGGVVQPLFFNLLVDPVAQVEQLGRRPRGTILPVALD